MRSPSNVLFVSMIRVDWSDLVLCNGFMFTNFLIHSEVAKVFQFLFASLVHFISRQFFAGDVTNAEDASVFGLLLQLCQYRVFLAIASCEAFDD